LKFARQFFTEAARDDLITRNPFAGIKAPSAPDESRKAFVDRATINAVLDACPDDEWRLIVALCRFNGLRCPSEVLALEWSAINWERDRMTILSPKLEHLDSGGLRVCPIFPETRAILDRCYDAAKEGERFVVTRYRQDEANLRQQLGRIIRKAGSVPWPKSFVNLRGSCETELMEKFPAHVVVAWLGHSVKIAQKHYTTVREEDFTKATSGSGAYSGAVVVQNAVQQAAASNRTGSQDSSEDVVDCEVMRDVAGPCESVQIGKYTRQESNL
jgi:integrase